MPHSRFILTKLLKERNKKMNGDYAVAFKGYP